MKTFLFICAAILFIGVANLPIGYYTFLRIAVSVGAGIICWNEWNNPSKGWLIVFGIILILFNPVIPVYLHDKSIWRVIDVISGVLFVVKAFESPKRDAEENGRENN